MVSLRFRSFAMAFGLTGLVLVALPAATALMPIDEVRPGMTGVGRTVFEGTRQDEFRVQVLGVLRNVMGPHRNLIVARLEGGPLAETGVIAGMSGSPVYIDGRLVGAVSYSLGAFVKEPIAGITPIGEMTDPVVLPIRRASAVQVRLDLPLAREKLAAALRDAYQRVRPFAERPDEIEALGLPLGVAGQLGARFRPIATPIVMTGFSGSVADMLDGALRDSGFAPVPGAPVGDAPGGETEGLEPGDAVGVSLVRGDLELGATGTVTYVDGSHVFAFGHPFFNLGPTEFPMTRAYVHTLLPSLLSSAKITSLGAVIGTFQQDRATAVAGTLGSGPALVPITLRLESDRGFARAFRFELVNDQFFTPLLTYLSIANMLASYERQIGSATLTVQGQALVQGHANLAFEDLFTGIDASLGAAAYIAGPVTFLLGNALEPVRIEGLDVTIRSSEEPRTATLERAWLDEVQPEAGRTVPLKVLTRTYGGEERIYTVPINIPANATGSLSVLVSDGLRLAQWEQRELRLPRQPASVAQMIRVLNNARKHNRLYVRLLSAEAGAVVHGETLPALPPSVLAVLEADRNGGSFTPLNAAVVGEWEVVTDYAISGSRLLRIQVDTGRPGG